jgi:hypothetical protein
MSDATAHHTIEIDYKCPMAECDCTQSASWSSLDFPTTLEGISAGDTLEGPFHCPDCEDRHIAHSNLFEVIDVSGNPENTDSDPQVVSDGGHDMSNPERCPCCGNVGETTEQAGTFKCEVRPCRVHLYQHADDGRQVEPIIDSQPQADTGRCINCGDEIHGDGVYTQSGVKSDGHERLQDGESVKISNLMEMDDGPYCSLACSLNTDTDPQGDQQ